MKIDKKLIKELSEYLDEFKLTEIEFTEKDTKIKVSKNNVLINNQAAPNIQNDLSAKNLVPNKSSVNVGSLHRRSSGCARSTSWPVGPCTRRRLPWRWRRSKRWASRCWARPCVHRPQARGALATAHTTLLFTCYALLSPSAGGPRGVGGRLTPRRPPRTPPPPRARRRRPDRPERTRRAAGGCTGRRRRRKPTASCVACVRNMIAGML